MSAQKIYDLSSRGLIAISGEQAVELLHGQLSCDVLQLTDCDFLLGAHCNPQGRIISLFHIFRRDDVFYLLMPINMIDIALSALQKYAVFYKVSCENVSGQHHLFYADAETPTITLLPINEKTDVTTMLSEADWHQSNINAGIAQLYPETSETLLPHHINLHKTGAINFEKGCFTGQEIIARMQYLGKLKQQFCKATTPHPTQPGAKVYANDSAVGTVVDYCKHHDHFHVLFTTKQSGIELYLNDQQPLTNVVVL